MDELMDITLYVEVYLLLFMVVALHKGVSIGSPIFLFACSYTVMLGLSPLWEYLYPRLGNACNPYMFILLPFGAFVLGSIVLSGRQSRAIRRSSCKMKPYRPLNKLVVYTFYCAAMLAGVFYLAQTGLSWGSESFESERISAQSGMGLFTYLNSTLVITLPVMYSYALDKKIPKWSFWIMTGLALAVFLLRGSRTLCLVPLGIMLVMKNQRSRISLPKCIAIAVVGVLALGIVGFIRGSGSSDTFDFVRVLSSVSSVSYENLTRISNAFPELIPFLHGSSYFMNFSILLPGPGTDFTMWLKEVLGLTFQGGGMTPSVVGDFYLNFGYAGMLLCMFLLGGVGNLLEKHIRNTNQNSEFCIYLVLMYVLLPYGGLSNSVLTIIINFVAWRLMWAVSQMIDRPPLFGKDAQGAGNPRISCHNSCTSYHIPLQRQ